MTQMRLFTAILFLVILTTSTFAEQDSLAHKWYSCKDSRWYQEHTNLSWSEVWFVKPASGLKLRESASANGNVITLMPQGTRVFVVSTTKTADTIGKVKGSWVNVALESGQTGWAFDAYLQAESPASWKDFPVEGPWLMTPNNYPEELSFKDNGTFQQFQGNQGDWKITAPNKIVMKWYKTLMDGYGGERGRGSFMHEETWYLVDTNPVDEKFHEVRILITGKNNGCRQFVLNRTRGGP